MTRSPIRATAALLAIVLLSTVGGAEGPEKIFPFPVTMFQLDNGLTVVSVDYDSPGIVAYYTVVRTGSRNEVEPGFSGYAHFFEHMMFRGTEKYPTAAYNDVIKRLGADSNAFTTDDWTTYHTVASADALETIIDLESDRFLNLSYSVDDYRTEAGAILGEYNLNFSNPFSLLRERLRDLAFTTHPYKHTTIGLLEDIKAMPDHYDYSVEFYDRYYRPNNALIVVVGDFDQAELERLTAQYYRVWEPGRFEPRVPLERAAASRGAGRRDHLAQCHAAATDDRVSRAGVLGPGDRHAGHGRAVAVAVLAECAALPAAVSARPGGRCAVGRCGRPSRPAAVRDHRADYQTGPDRLRPRRHPGRD